MPLPPIEDLSHDIRGRRVLLAADLSNLRFRHGGPKPGSEAKRGPVPGWFLFQYFVKVQSARAEWVDAEKSAPDQRSAFIPRRGCALFNHNKVRIARADHAFRIYKAVHVNCDPTAIHEHEVRVADQPEMARPESLDEELLRMPPKTEHFAVTRPELLLVHCRRLIRARHVRLARARTRPRLSPVYVRSAPLNIRLSTHVCARLRFCLRFSRLLLLRRLHFLSFHRRCRLRFVCLPLRLLWLRILA